MVYLNAIHESDELSLRRARSNFKERLDDDLMIHCMCFLFSVCLNVNFCDSNPYHTMPHLFIIGFVLKVIIDNNVKLQRDYEARGINLRRYVHQITNNHQFVSNTSIAKRELANIQDILFDLRKDIPEGKYIDIMNKTKRAYETL